MFDPNGNDVTYSLIKSTFPCLATLMLMNNSHMTQLYLHLGLSKKNKVKNGYILYPCHDAWDHLISSEKELSLETNYFSINNKRHVYIKVGNWSLKLFDPKALH